MNFLPIDKVRGEHFVTREVAASIPAGTRFADPARFTASAAGPVETINWRMLCDRLTGHDSCVPSNRHAFIFRKTVA